MSTDKTLKAIETKAAEIIEDQCPWVLDEVGTATTVFGDRLAVHWQTQEGEIVYLCSEKVYTLGGEQINPLIERLVEGWQEMRDFIEHAEHIGKENQP